MAEQKVKLLQQLAALRAAIRAEAPSGSDAGSTEEK